MKFTPELGQACEQLVQILAGSGIPYAVGGAVAMAFGGYLRGTHDLDVLVLIPALRYQEIADALNAAGFVMRDENDRPATVEVPPMLRASREMGHFRIWWANTRVELFPPRVPLQDAVLQRRVQVDLDGLSVWVTTAEDLILLKMIFHRPKDIEDVRRLLAANRGSLDVAYIESWIPRTLEVPVGGELRRMLQQSGCTPGPGGIDPGVLP